jgi:asparagine synthase (glutamine-hydrolysing)
MSIIFGIRAAEGGKVEEPRLVNLGRATNRFALDGTFALCRGRVGMGFQPYHTHQRSCLESQPLVDDRGNMLTLDGRLDNHTELCGLLKIQDQNLPDSVIVLTAFERWGEACFSRFVGDWALSLWCDTNRSLYLARDHAGTRTLYFELAEGVILWSTFLETFMTGKKSRDLDEGFAACYLSCQPIRDLTPYKGITAVSPAHYYVVREDKITRKTLWQWMVKDTIRYRTDTEYEEHFLSLFQQSVRRRTGPGAPILAQLSGGMDSSSIVCVSDHMRRDQGASPDELIDTLSYYDDSEPSWNERPYFTAVEQERGKSGVHIEASFMDRTYEPVPASEGVYHLPGPDSSAIEFERKVAKAVDGYDYRVILSGNGGDEVLGGVPLPYPELADYAISGSLRLLLKSAVAWSLTSRTPLIQTLFQTSKYIYDLYRPSYLDANSTPAWLAPHLKRICSTLKKRDRTVDGRLGRKPGSVSNGIAWWSVLEALPSLFPCSETRYEYRYPYLDRDLVEFLFSIPREQLVRPGRRRSLMRRALRNIVPEEILERRRKAFLIRGALASVQMRREKIEALFKNSPGVRYGFVRADELHSALEITAKGIDPGLWAALNRAITFDLWLTATSEIKQAVQQSKDYMNSAQRSN